MKATVPTDSAHTIVYVPATQKEWIRRLEAAGWTLERGGKHQAKMTKAGSRPVTLPANKRRAYSKSFEAQLRRETGLQDGRS
jgi:predicted RNA binding protein YcfA (HicA-like mRNA interferase family)